MAKYEEIISKSSCRRLDLLMILVTLGTQDKPFTRLLDAIEKAINDGVIKEEVIVQAGHTKYESSNMKIFDLIPADEFEKLVKKCRILITHGGVGSITTGLKAGKVVIAAARLSKYKEHTNDHQKQIIREFVDAGYLVELKDFNQLGKTLAYAKKFHPKKFESNTKNFISIIENYIKEDSMKKEEKKKITLRELYQKYREVIMYLIFGVLTTVVALAIYYGLVYTIIDPQNAFLLQVANFVSWFGALIFAYVTNRKFVFQSHEKNKVKEALSFAGARLVTLFMDMAIMFVGVTLLHGNDKIIKLISQVVVIVANYIFSKIFVFKKN